MATYPQVEQQVGRLSRTWVAVAAVVVLGVALALFFSTRRGSTQIRTAQASRETITDAVSTNGKIEAIDNFEAHAPAPSTVKRLLVKEGQQVKVGQLLVQLDDSNARSDAARALAQVRAAEADLTAIENGGTQEEVFTNKSELNRVQAEVQAAQRNLDTLKKLQQSGAASVAEVSEAQARLANAQNQVQLLQQRTGSRFATVDKARAEANLAQAKAAYQAAQDQVAKSNVTSGTNGTVYSLPVQVGHFVNAGDLVVQVADLAKMQVRAYVDEPDIGRLSAGQPVEITWEAVPGRKWEGKVSQVPTSVSQHGARTVGELLSLVDNSDKRLIPNVNVNVTVVTARDANAITVPREAVHEDPGGSFIYEIVNETVTKKTVQTGLSNLTRVQIKQGLGDNATLALGTYNGQPLKEGMTIKK